jgi:SAM-dependent methyltransferase
MTQPRVQPSHWNEYARRWQLIGPPLRPGRVDVEHVSRSVSCHRTLREASCRDPEPALLLGVTPELASISWQPPFELLAVDKSEGMLAAVWPGDSQSRRAKLGDWLELSLPPASVGLVMGDGVFSLLQYPDDYRRLAENVALVLRAGGLFALRAFTRVEPAESIADVFGKLYAGGIGSFHAFKWRLAMALQGDATRGVDLASIWECFRAHVASNSELAQQTGFPEQEIESIDSYRGVAERYSYSTASELVSLLAPKLDLLEQWLPTYELGERCPHLLFRRNRT